MIIDIDHINIVVSSMDKTLEFFNLFGFEQKETAILEGDWISELTCTDNVSMEYAMLMLPNSNISIQLAKYNSPASETADINSKASTIGYRHIALKVVDLEKEYNRLKKHNIIFNSKPYQRGNKKLVYFTGPDNIIMELAEYL
ncbi:MAG TPA: VOC family protein [Victivallales bacterium]|nr:VOC family protein [Victivallales bacterium]